MRPVRILLLTLATLFVLTLAAFAILSKPAPPAAADDDIIIKGGSMEIQCGRNHKSDNAGCLSLDDALTGHFKHKQDGKHITRIVVKNSANTVVFNSDTLNANNALGTKPEIDITYK